MKKKRNFMGISAEDFQDLEAKTRKDSYFSGVLHGMFLQQEFQEDQIRRRHQFLGKLSAGVIALAIVLMTAINVISNPKDASTEQSLARAEHTGIHAVNLSTDTDEKMTIVECPVRLADIDGLSIEKHNPDQWSLCADQDVLVWFDLPDDIKYLRATIVSRYPYMVKAGEVGTISFEVSCSTNHTKYIGSLDFLAADDLTLGAVCNGTNLRNQSIGVNNDTCRDFTWMEAGKHTYVHYPLYTSCDGKYEVYPIESGKSSVGYNVSYEINAIGAPKQDHSDDYPGETLFRERYGREYPGVNQPGPKTPGEIGYKDESFGSGL